MCGGVSADDWGSHYGTKLNLDLLLYSSKDKTFHNTRADHKKVFTEEFCGRTAGQAVEEILLLCCQITEKCFSTTNVCAVCLFYLVLGMMVTLALFTDDARKHTTLQQGDIH